MFSRPRLRALAAAGATAARNARARSPRRSEIVITMLPDAPDVERVALGPNGIVEGIRPGAVYIDMSTIDPDTTRKVGAAIARKGARDDRQSGRQDRGRGGGWQRSR